MLENKHLNKRRVIILSLPICLVLIIGGLICWIPERSAENNLDRYIKRLEDSGYIVEEHPITEFHVDNVFEFEFFGDFLQYSRQENVYYMYTDREIKALYFLHEPPGGGTEVNIFYAAKEFIVIKQIRTTLPILLTLTIPLVVLTFGYSKNRKKEKT